MPQLPTRPMIELSANFRRYEPVAMDAISRIAAARARVEAAAIRPAAEDELRASALAETIHYSTLIEGNELPMIEAERAARGGLDPDTRAKVELVNYVDALRLLDELAERREIEASPELLLALHRRATRGLGADDSERFKPHHEGAWRDGVAVVVDRPTGRVMHEAPPPDEVSPRVEGLCAWIAAREDRMVDFPPPVIAGVAHYAVTDIHPFADGNGRVARLFTAAMLMRLGFLPRRLFSFERYYAEDRQAYYAALRSVRENTLNMGGWLSYFLRGLASEYERVADKVAEFEGLGLRADGPFQLSATQERGLAQLNLSGLVEFSRIDYERMAKVRKSKANRELKGLEDAGLIGRRGRGPGARYRFRVKPWKERRGRKREWTDARIELELRELCQGREGWPSIAEFRAAGRMSLYEAVRRHGGSSLWAERIGLRN